MSDCKHRDEYPENVMLPAAVALEHFTECMTPEARLEYWETVRHWSDAGTHCLLTADHKGIIERQRAYTLKLLTGIRKVVEELQRVDSANEARVAERLEGLIS